MDDREANFLIFSAGYERFFRPLQAPIAAALLEAKRDGRRAARVVDKLLWIAGNPRPQEVLHRARNATARDHTIARTALDAAAALMR